MSTSSSQPPVEDPETQARLASARKLTNIMLLSMGGGVIGLILFGLYEMVAMILKYS